jgi:hypothetical protein
MAVCDICGVPWRRSLMHRDGDGLMVCPNDAGPSKRELTEANLALVPLPYEEYPDGGTPIAWTRADPIPADVASVPYRDLGVAVPMHSTGPTPPTLSVVSGHWVGVPIYIGVFTPGELGVWQWRWSINAGATWKGGGTSAALITVGPFRVSIAPGYASLTNSWQYCEWTKATF